MRGTLMVGCLLGYRNTFPLSRSKSHVGNNYLESISAALSQLLQPGGIYFDSKKKAK